jgi:hypothetical protein
MHKKIILTVLIFSMLLQLIGCYNMQHISKNELIKENNEDEIIILTKNDSLYSFLTHTVVNDSIFGKGYVKSVVSRKEETSLNNYLKNVYSDSDFSEPFTGKVAMEDILEIRQDKINWDSTKLLIGGLIITAIIVGGILILADFSNSFN